MDLLSKFSKGQIYQALISSSLFIIYLLVLGAGFLTGEINTEWILDRFIGLSFVGLVLLVIFPVWEKADSLIAKVIKQMGIGSFFLLILTWFIYFIQLMNLAQPTGTLEKVVFDLSRRFAFYTLFPPIILLIYGNVEWDELLDFGDAKAD